MRQEEALVRKRRWSVAPSSLAAASWTLLAAARGSAVVYSPFNLALAVAEVAVVGATAFPPRGKRSGRVKRLRSNYCQSFGVPTPGVTGKHQ